MDYPILIAVALFIALIFFLATGLWSRRHIAGLSGRLFVFVGTLD